MKTRKNWAGFAVGLMCGAVIFGGAGYAAGVVATPLSVFNRRQLYRLSVNRHFLQIIVDS